MLPRLGKLPPIRQPSSVKDAAGRQGVGRELARDVTPEESEAMTGLAYERLTSAGSAALGVAPLDVCEDIASRFDALYAAYQPLLRKIAIRKFGIPTADVDDLVQDVFATYLANPTNVRDLHPYLIGAICNASRQYRRRGDASCLSARPEHRICSATPDDELIDGVVRNLVIRATLGRLGQSCRETLERFYLMGETTVSIARSREKSANYICRLLNYCRNRARVIFAEINTRS
jgi:RNA polymerase sigma factor (sigma-70 family)